MPLDNNRPIMPLHINRSGRRVMVMVMHPMFVMAIPVPSIMPAVVVCQGYAGPNKDQESCNCEYFHYVAFHGVLLLALNLHRLDGTPGRRVYIGFWECMEPQCPGKLTTIPAGPIFQSDCRDGLRCRKSPTIHFRHKDCLVIRGGLFPLLLAGHPFFSTCGPRAV
jgi:hypothetical protein